MPISKKRGATKPASGSAKGTRSVKAPAAEEKTASKLEKPPRSYEPTAPARVAEILKRLDRRYPDAKCALIHKSAWELLVATILSAQSTDVGVNKVTPVIFKKYPTPQDFAALTPEELEPDIRSTGFYHNKAKSVIGAAKAVVKRFGGKVPDTLAELITIPGAARKTANVVLGVWFKKAEGIVVDTHVHRISRRLELTQADDPVRIERDLMQIIPSKNGKWIDFSHQLIHHGRQLCTARSPKCADCPLEDLCHAADKTWSTVPMHRGAR